MQSVIKYQEKKKADHVGWASKLSSRVRWVGGEASAVWRGYMCLVRSIMKRGPQEKCGRVFVGKRTGKQKVCDVQFPPWLETQHCTLHHRLFDAYKNLPARWEKFGG